VSVTRYLASLPERAIRSALGLGAGVAKETGDVVLPAAVRNSQLYQNLVSTTLRFVIETVGEVEGVYAKEAALPADFLTRRGIGNAIEMLGIVAFRASPVWVLAALADVSGMGRTLVPQIAAELKSQGMLDPDTEFTSADQMLDGLERTSGRLAGTVNAPPLDVATLRRELAALREDARGLQPAGLPTGESVQRLWLELQAESARQERSVFQTSSIIAVAAVQAGVTVTGRVIGKAWVDHYTQTLQSIRDTGYATYAAQHLAPYAKAAAGQFSPRRRTWTERLIERFDRSRG
jgi:hypothetical protein